MSFCLKPVYEKLYPPRPEKWETETKRVLFQNLRKYLCKKQRFCKLPKVALI